MFFLLCIGIVEFVGNRYGVMETTWDPSIYQSCCIKLQATKMHFLYRITYITFMFLSIINRDDIQKPFYYRSGRKIEREKKAHLSIYVILCRCCLLLNQQKNTQLKIGRFSIARTRFSHDCMNFPVNYLQYSFFLLLWRYVFLPFSLSLSMPFKYHK